MPSNRMTRIAVPIAIVIVVLMMVVPLPAALLDILIALNIGVSLIVLLVALQVQRVLDFAIFPTIVLVATIFRLALNVSSTRLVLRDGFAGHVIDAFGHIVIGANLIIGLVIFAILIIIQLTVVTNGASRVAEVGARFTLDAMPGKQMAIDADLNSGLIDEDTARQRRKDVAAEADFYGAMDGGTKFVKGDAMAAVIITLVNLIGGFAIGMLQRGMAAGEAIQTYSLLSVGDGLVSQIPALLMSVATGVIVTRSTGAGDVGSDLIKQLGRHRQALMIGGASLLGLCLIPGMPKLPFLIVGGMVLFMAFRSTDGGAETESGAEAMPGQGAIAMPSGQVPLPAGGDRDPVTDSLRVDPLELLLSPDAVDLVDAARGGDLLDRVRALRRKTALDLGLVLPPVRTRDGAMLAPGTYEIRIGGSSVATGEAPPGHLLAIGDSMDGLPGRHTTEPVFGLPAVWVPIEYRASAELAGATIVERAAVVTTHLAEMVRQNASRLLSLDDTRDLLEVLKGDRPAAVEELVPGVLPLSAIQRLLQALLDEQVSIRDLGRVLEGVGQRARTTQDPDALLEAARAALGPALAAQYVRDGVLRAITLEPAVETQIGEALRASEQGVVIALDPVQAQRLVSDISALQTTAEQRGELPVLLISGPLRLPMRRLLRGSLPQLPVIAFTEATGIHQIETVGQVSSSHEFAS
ncbi:FHIPEP family type III secretion protein [Kineosporia sp. J2-2]|uniref:FHIPEP family type III secretion protein n=1 Tax=Kineosporia corallincola TaxID=2835133 RepID=A0ABS5TJV5_9ACTN|nr:flagellar biosynthesis protein FlhA [Kineosporia corallincola]MBT0771393.1 FHIPEP family type III secretion protein [Kineosporia corallincola]